MIKTVETYLIDATAEVPVRAELVKSLRDHGQLNPIIVRPRGARYEVVEGKYRLAALWHIGVKRVYCEVVEMTDTEVAEYRALMSRPTDNVL